MSVLPVVGPVHTVVVAAQAMAALLSVRLGRTLGRGGAVAELHAGPVRRIALDPTAFAVALVRSGTPRSRTHEFEATVGPGVEDLQLLAVHVLFNQVFVAREVDIAAIGADPDQPGAGLDSEHPEFVVEARAYPGRNQLRPSFDELVNVFGLVRVAGVSASSVEKKVRPSLVRKRPF